jgi:hypothetical protein
MIIVKISLKGIILFKHYEKMKKMNIFTVHDLLKMKKRVKSRVFRSIRYIDFLLYGFLSKLLQNFSKYNYN